MGLQISSHTAAQSGVGDEGRQPAGTPGVVHRHDDPVFAVAHLAGRSRVGRNGHRPAQHLCLTYGHRLALVAGGLGVDVACRYVRVRVGALAQEQDMLLHSRLGDLVADEGLVAAISDYVPPQAADTVVLHQPAGYIGDVVVVLCRTETAD